MKHEERYGKKKITLLIAKMNSLSNWMKHFINVQVKHLGNFLRKCLVLKSLRLIKKLIWLHHSLIYVTLTLIDHNCIQTNRLELANCIPLWGRQHADFYCILQVCSHDNCDWCSQKWHPHSISTMWYVIMSWHVSPLCFSDALSRRGCWVLLKTNWRPLTCIFPAFVA